MSTSTKVNKLKINKLLKEQYNSITPSDTELYFVLDEEDTLPSQAGQAGKYLTTNGSKASWKDVGGLPSQEGNEGKFLTTDGTDTSWANIPTEIPTQSGNSGKYLYTNGTNSSWANLDLTQGSSALATSGTVTLSDNSI